MPSSIPPQHHHALWCPHAAQALRHACTQACSLLRGPAAAVCGLTAAAAARPRAAAWLTLPLHKHTPARMHNAHAGGGEEGSQEGKESGQAAGRGSSGRCVRSRLHARSLGARPQAPRASSKCQCTPDHGIVPPCLPSPTRVCAAPGEGKKKKKKSSKAEEGGGEADTAVAAPVVEVAQGSSKKAAKKAAKAAAKAAVAAGEQEQPQELSGQQPVAAATVVSLVPRTIALQQQPKGGWEPRAGCCRACEAACRRGQAALSLRPGRWL